MGVISLHHPECDVCGYVAASPLVCDRSAAVAMSSAVAAGWVFRTVWIGSASRSLFTCPQCLARLQQG